MHLLNWWMRIFAQRPPHIAAISAPCPPWSRAASAPGLKHHDGRLLLRMADVCGSARVPVVVLEQVEGFPQHPDFQEVCRAWTLSGYKVLWQCTLDTQAILPAARKRHLMVLAHRDTAAGFPLPQVSWNMGRQPTLAMAQALLDLPPEVLADLQPDANLLAKYLDPWLVPQGALLQTTEAAIRRYRIKTPERSAGCFMAQYSFQHELPLDLLERRAGTVGA